MTLRILPDFLKTLPHPDHRRLERPPRAPRCAEEAAWREWLAHVEAGRISASSRS